MHIAGPSVFFLGAVLAAQVGWHDPPFLVPRNLACGAHDAARGITYLLGGFSDTYRMDLWAYDGRDWQMVAPAPSSSSPYSLAFDAARDRLVAVLPHLADKWLAEFDGTQWNLLLEIPYTPTYPYVDPFTYLAYDMARNQMLLMVYSYQAPGRPWVGQLWQWTGTALVAVGGPTAPTGMMAFDSARGCMVVVDWNRTSEWNGSSWRTVPGVTPLDDNLAYDPSVQRVVTFKWGASYRPSELWEWDGTTWRLRPSLNMPTRQWPMLVGEMSRNRLLLYGGNEDNVDRGDTWACVGTNWQQVAPDPGGPPLLGARAAQDGQGRLLLFGGMAARQPTDQTWAYDGQAWKRLQPGHAPPPRSGHCMAADPATGNVYLFGGIAAAGSVLGDAWRFDGTDWQPLRSGPPDRSDAGLCFDGARQRLVLYGGRADSTVLADTWEFDGQQWQQRAVWPPNDGQVHLAFDPRRHRAVLITKGLGRLQTWEWDGTWWFSTDPLQRPYPSDQSSLVYEPERQRIMVVQGENAVPPGGVWEWDGCSWRSLGTDHRLERNDMAVAYVAGHGVLAYGGEGVHHVVVTHAIEMRSDHPAAATTFGSGCPGSVGVPAIAVLDPPWTGDELTLEIAPVADTALVVLATGFSATSWHGVPLPIDLGPQGFPGCWLHVGPESPLWLPVHQGTAVVSVPVPMSPSLVGQEVFQQGLVFEAVVGLATSAGLRLVVGQR